MELDVTYIEINLPAKCKDLKHLIETKTSTHTSTTPGAVLSIHELDQQPHESYILIVKNCPGTMICMAITCGIDRKAILYWPKTVKPAEIRNLTEKMLNRNLNDWLPQRPLYFLQEDLHHEDN
ncbi:hypothetical protein J6590_083573 [Homalodisca vitripennis]|nr:hypothetical protein J6590_083573 [Homalodisca vitripennis]